MIDPLNCSRKYYESLENESRGVKQGESGKQVQCKEKAMNKEGKIHPGEETAGMLCVRG